MDLFNSSKDANPLNALSNASYFDIVLNYMTWGEYKERLYESKVTN